ncbi:GTPase [Methylomicrobium lacus]|uniref:GTPase n=1 Tax=Methylomicrobium lacus TaxID=136992 RepID=UPI00045E666F|nr:GTPase [Methylomicrobium lacus]
MLEFIQLLKQRYQTILQQAHLESIKGVYQQRIDQLLMAEAFLRKGALVESAPLPPLQIAVVGPTQAGKSTLVNVLLQSGAAGVSPLAGYTVHPQGFCHRVRREDCGGLQRYFGRFQQLLPMQLSKDRHDCFSLADADSQSSWLPDCVLWDTPDFDSIDSATYREGVIRTIALADVVVLVVSKEKYADQSVWEMMAALEVLRQPTVICLNKLSEGSEALIAHSLQGKWQLARKDPFPEVVPLYYQKASGLPVWPQAQQGLLQRLAGQVSYKKHARYEQELLQYYWPQWLEPIAQEHQALKDWQQLLEHMIKQALDNYQRDFLNHPHHYETFQVAMAELLTLLEIPGLAGIMAGTRRALTWPVRQLMKLGRKKSALTETSHEVALLNQIAEHALLQMTDKLRDKAEGNQQRLWWRDMSALLRGRRQELLIDFDGAVRHYHLTFQQDVESAAHRLYRKLQEQPLLLNSLRATRVTTDAAMIALALNTGGIGVHDLVIAPSLLTVTSLLAESAIGSYLHSVEADLKRNQLSQVKQALFIEALRDKLLLLPTQLSGLSHFNITPEQLQEAENHLKEKRHGLRLL